MVWDEARELWDRAESAVHRELTTPAVRIRPMLPFSLRRLTMPIGVTGRRGAGKTLLYDAVVGRVGTGYTPRGKSEDAEAHKVLLDNRHGRRSRSLLVVVPGQESQERSRTLRTMLSADTFPTGLVHVVCFGHNRIWDSNDRAVVAQERRAVAGRLTVEDLRDREMSQELRDFEDVCNRLRDAWTRRSRVWLIIAVAKCDLYWPRIAEARDYYLPGDGPDSPFRTALRGLVGHVGSGNVAGLAVLPFSCYPETHEFDPTLPKQPPGLDFRQATALVNNFRDVLGDFSGRQ